MYRHKNHAGRSCKLCSETNLDSNRRPYYEGSPLHQCAPIDFLVVFNLLHLHFMYYCWQFHLIRILNSFDCAQCTFDRSCVNFLFLWLIHPSELYFPDLIPIFSPQEVIKQSEWDKDCDCISAESAVPRWHSRCARAAGHIDILSQASYTSLRCTNGWQRRWWSDEMRIARWLFRSEGLCLLLCNHELHKSWNGSLQWAQEGSVPPPYTRGRLLHGRLVIDSSYPESVSAACYKPYLSPSAVLRSGS